MNYNEDKDQVLAAIIAQLKKLPAGTSTRFRDLFRECFPDDPMPKSKALSDLYYALQDAAEKAGLYLDDTHHNNMEDDRPYNLDFIVKPLKPVVSFDVVRYTESTWSEQPEELTIDLRNHTISYVSSYSKDREHPAIHKCTPSEWDEIADLVASCRFNQWEESYIEPGGTLWKVDLLKGNSVVKGASGRGGYPNCWRMFTDLRWKCQELSDGRAVPYMKMDESWFMEWYSTQAAPEERRLVDKVFRFETRFKDLIFKKGTSTYKLLQCQSKLQNSNKWIDGVTELPHQLTYFSYMWFHFKVEPLPFLCRGVFEQEKQTLTVTPEVLEKNSTILHELIHLHEFVINSLPMYFHDMVYWALYKDLKKKIPELDDIITGHAHLLTAKSIYKRGGLHDTLFLLKSFDLDIRMRYKLGRVFGYGLVEELKSYSYITGTKR